MKKTAKISIFLFSILSAFLPIQKVLAWEPFNPLSYQPLAPIDGVNLGTGGQGVDLATYLGSIFKLGIGLCGVFAVLMIVIGGLEYVMTDKVASKEDAKTKISGAIVGLLLALSSYILLYTINPDLVSLNFLKIKTSTPQVSLGSNTSVQNTKNSNPIASNPGDAVKINTNTAPTASQNPETEAHAGQYCFQIEAPSTVKTAGWYGDRYGRTVETICGTENECEAKRPTATAKYQKMGLDGYIAMPCIKR